MKNANITFVHLQFINICHDCSNYLIHKVMYSSLVVESVSNKIFFRKILFWFLQLQHVSVTMC